MDSFLDKRGLSHLWAKIKSLVNTARPRSSIVTLSAARWAGGGPFTQNITVNGIVSDETKQIIIPTPTNASMNDYISAKVRCTGQANNSLTFECQVKPANDITLYVIIQEATR